MHVPSRDTVWPVVRLIASAQHVVCTHLRVEGAYVRMCVHVCMCTCAYICMCACVVAAVVIVQEEEGMLLKVMFA